MSKFADIQIDPAIIQRAARGDGRAHEILYRAFATPVYSLCLRFTRVPAHAEDLERPREAGSQDGALPAWEFPPPQYPARLPVESVGEALGVLKPAPMEIQLLSGPSILPLGLLLLGLGAGRLAAREE